MYKSICKQARALWADEQGQDLAEYALVVALIGLGCVTAAKTLANYITNSFTAVGSALAADV